MNALRTASAGSAALFALAFAAAAGTSSPQAAWAQEEDEPAVVGEGESARLVSEWQAGAPGQALDVLVVAPTGEWALAAGADDGAVTLWDVAEPGDEEALGFLIGHEVAVTAAAASQCGRYALTGARDGALRVWDVAAREAVHELAPPRQRKKARKAKERRDGEREGVLAVAFSPDAKHAASVGADRTIRIWDLSRGKQVWRFRKLDHPDTQLVGAAFSADGERLLLETARDGDRQLELWHLRSLAALMGLPRTVLQRQRLDAEGEGAGGAERAPLAIAPDGDEGLTLGTGDQVRLFDLELPGFERRSLAGHEDRIRALALGPEGRLAASADEEGAVRLWDLEAGAERDVFALDDDAARAIAFHPEGGFLIATREGALLRFEMAPLRVLFY